MGLQGPRLQVSAVKPEVGDRFRIVTQGYQHVLEALFAFAPILAIAYLQAFQDPSLRYEDHAFHEIMIGLAILMAAFITYIAWRCYLHSGERFLYWLTAGFLGFTLIYAWHGVFTRLAHDHMALFLLYGPASRLTLGVCLLAATMSYDQIADPPDRRRKGWFTVASLVLLLDTLVAALAYSSLASGPELRIGMEASALVLSLVCLALLWLRRIRSPLMIVSGLALTMFAQSSLSFLLALPWDHQWWLAHVIFAGGFLVLSYGVVRAYLTTRSFAGFVAEEELLARLTETDDQLAATLAQLRETNERLEAKVLERTGELGAILDTVLDGILTSDDTGVIQTANPAVCRLFGYTAGDLVGQNISLLMPRSEVGGHESYMERYRRTGERRIIGVGREVIGQRKDGSVFPLGLAVAEMKQGTRRQFVGVLRDLTTEKQIEQQLRVAAVAFDSRDGMVVTDPRGVILRVNQAFTEVTGYSSEEVVGRTPAILRSGRQSSEFYRKMWEAIRREAHWEGEIWNRRKDGGVYPEWLSISAIRDADGATTNYLGVFSDITEPREAERRILELAFYDPLTGLPNRRLLIDRLNQALAGSRRSGYFGALMLLDLDQFKTINDTRGHDVGDKVLVQIGGRLRQALRETDTAARLGGDEFVVLLEDLGTLDVGAATAAESSAEKLRTELARPCLVNGDMHHFTVSIGVTLFHDRAQDSEMLLRQADLALYQAKDAGRDTTRFYNPTMQAAVDARASLEAGLRRALIDDELLLHFQPQVDQHGCTIGAEALVRWLPAGQGMVSPAAFIPVAEQSGLILSIGHWVLESACRQLADWASRSDTRELRLAVNISARQFRQPDFFGKLRTILERTGADPTRLKLELTESSVVQDIEQAIAIMTSVKTLGVGFSMDDFGTGYSSLANLKRLPLDELKIDQQFVRDVPANSDDCAIAQAIIALGHSLRLRVVAEGVETMAQRDYLLELGCRTFQGYLFGCPGPVEALGTGVNTMTE
jgi:diguanylate cyclase (GGDEF)-like protein/PAS domain S-box-containing protein